MIKITRTPQNIMTVPMEDLHTGETFFYEGSPCLMISEYDFVLLDTGDVMECIGLPIHERVPLIDISMEYDFKKREDK